MLVGGMREALITSFMLSTGRAGNSGCCCGGCVGAVHGGKWGQAWEEEEEERPGGVLLLGQVHMPFAEYRRLL